MRTSSRAALAATAAGAVFALLADSGSAQVREEPRATPACHAEALTPALPLGEKATPITFELDQPIGEVETIEVQDTGSGLRLAAPADLPRSAMATEDDENAKAIMLNNEGRRVTLWLNTEEVAEPGTYEVQLRGPEGDCAASVEIGRTGGPGV